jgi:hypothetical protein
MKLRAPAALLILLAFTSPLRASSADSESGPTPSVLDQTLEFLHLKPSPKAKKPPVIHHQIELKLAVVPSSINLSEDRELQVTVSLFNRSKKPIDLNFPTSQRIEVLVFDSSGKVVETWSEDQSFTNDPATITVDPGERLEYVASVATREMAAGHPYLIQASFPSYPDLKIEQQVVPH